MYITDIKNNVNFERLKIKINGAEFKKNPKAKKQIQAAIENNEGIQDFFKNHNGTIRVKSGYTTVTQEHEYPDVLKIVPGRSYPFDKFTVKEQSYYTDIKCSYNRAFALRNLFRKPVWVNAGIKAPKGEKLTWNECVDFTIKLIKEKLAEAITGCENRRLKVEKP